MRERDPARDAAVRLLCQVEAGARLEPLLGGLEAQLPDGRDRRFVHQLAAGVLKWRDRLDWVVDSFASRPVASLSPSVRQILRLGAYQLLFLDRVPQRAAVHTAVDMAKRHGHAGIGAFANAVLRRVAADGRRVTYPGGGADAEDYLAVYYSHPRWLVARWLRRWGPDRTRALLQANNETPALYVRRNARRGTVGDLPQIAGTVAVAGRTDVLEVPEPEGFFESSAFREGHCFVQDLNAGLAAELLDAQPGDRVLDLCAAPGGKSIQLALACGAGVVACDLSAHRLARLAENARRLGLRSIRLLAADAAVPALGPGRFDRAMVDVPCSGTGVLARHPEARWRKEEADLAVQATRQLAILEGAFACLRPGGVLVYSTCSLEEEENDAVVDRFLSRRTEAQLEPAGPRFPGQPWAGRTVQTLPGRDRGDGAFAARIRKRAA